MRSAKPAAAAVFAAIALSACGAAHPGHGKVDNPLTAKTDPYKCLQQKQLAVKKISVTEIPGFPGTNVDGLYGFQIGALPAGPTVVYEPTPGAAQVDQIHGLNQFAGAEVIGQSLLYPHQASDKELNKIEDCLARGVAG
jgi:hypothetical protein